MNLRRAFAGVAPGEVCTGTVHFWGLDTNRLLEAGVIRLGDNRRDYYLVRVPQKEQHQ